MFNDLITIIIIWLGIHLIMNQGGLTPSKIVLIA